MKIYSAIFGAIHFFGRLQKISMKSRKKYLEAIVQEFPEFVDYFDRFRENDALGDPITFDYQEFGRFSPTTLRYIKYACDIKKTFGSLKDKQIVEIGGGYGGFCKILFEALGFASYTIIDYPQCLPLIEKYLLQLDGPPVCYLTKEHLSKINSPDLVISHFGFSEMDSADQMLFLEQLINKSSHGYLTMNFISSRLNSLPIEKIVRFLLDHSKQGTVVKELPNTHPDNVVVSWHPLLPKIEVESKKKPKIEQVCRNGNGLTYSFSGGRLGDNLLAYFHAKWAAYQTGLPFFYHPFPYSDAFSLSKRDRQLSSNSFHNQITIQQLQEIEKTPSSTLFTVPYFPESFFEYQTRSLWMLHLPYYSVDWKEPAFRAEVAACLKPTQTIPTFKFPQGCINVGVHIRRGGGLDTSLAHHLLPLKFPPDDYYIQQIRTIAAIFPDQKIYIHIFTDDLNPKEIARNYKRALHNPQLKFGYRKKNNRPDANVLEDFFAMQKFDCLILCQSNYSLVASKVKDYTILITPIHAVWMENRWIIDEIELSFLFSGTKWTLNPN